MVLQVCTVALGVPDSQPARGQCFDKYTLGKKGKLHFLISTNFSVKLSTTMSQQREY